MAYAILYLKTGEYVYSTIRDSGDTGKTKLTPAIFKTYVECKEAVSSPGLLVVINPDSNTTYNPDTLVVMRSKIQSNQLCPYGWLSFNAFHLLEIVEV